MSDPTRLAHAGPHLHEEPANRRWRPSPIVLGVVAVAWVIALVAEFTGAGDQLHHHELVGTSIPVGTALLLFLVAWQFHVAAMMLPASLPVIALFNRASADQAHPHRVRAAFLGGYLVVWTAFGLAALLGDAALHAIEDRWQPLAENHHVVMGVVLVTAGAFQFSSLKDRCLDQCRHPVPFLLAHYRRGLAGAFDLGRRHGQFCVGCCWALMLVMFAVGIANLAWMAPLALLMIYEKTAPGAERVVRPIGAALIVLGAVVIADPSWMPEIADHDHGSPGDHSQHDHHDH